MKLNVLVIAAIIATGAGCAAPVTDQREVAASADALTLEECAENRDACFQRNPLFGLFTCPVQYTQCVATADNGIPAQVAAAISDARDCAAEGRSCRGDASTPADLLQCTRHEAECVAAIVDANLPEVVTGTVECVDGAVGCILAAETPNELLACGETLEACAVDQVLDIVPPAVGAVIEDVGNCTFLLAECTAAATRPSELTQCAEDEVVCVANGLGVTLRDPPVAEAVQCAESAVACTFEARSISSLASCGTGLLECTADQVHQELTCAQQWTACMAGNPFNFFGCAAELASCQD